MKVVGLSCSPRKGGNTEILVGEALGGAKEAGAEVELVSVVGKELKPCDGCWTCSETGKCHIKDDMPAIFEKLLGADGIIIGSPTYHRSVTAQTAAIIQRSVSLTGHRLQSKVGAPIAVTALDGAWSVITTLYLFFIAHHMFCTDHVMGLGNEKGEVRKHEFAMKWAWAQGRQVVALASQGWQWPKEDKGYTDILTRVMSIYPV